MSDVFPQAELQGPIYCWVAGKAPKTDHWNHKSNLLTLQQIQEGKEAFVGHRLRDGVGPVLQGFCALTLIRSRSDRSSPTPRSVNVAKRDLANLPPTATVISGKPNRWRAYFRVPSEWWPDLSIQPEPGRPGAAVGRR